MTAEAFAPAKINLTLHVTGRRADGYHLLDSLVVFADVGDRVTAAPAERMRLAVTGRFASEVPSGPDNLVLRAAAFLEAPPTVLSLDKALPAASGIGGGSSDAAAALRALSDLYGVSLPAETAALGADVPVCLLARPARMSGIGETLAPVTGLPPLHLVLANPGAALPTSAVFAALAGQFGAPMRADLPAWDDAPALTAWLASQRNDLEAPARGLAPAVGVVLARLAATEGCLVARMSGSGATCFGLYATRPEADAAALALSAAHPDWWIQSASTWRLR